MYMYVYVYIYIYIHTHTYTQGDDRHRFCRTALRSRGCGLPSYVLARVLMSLSYYTYVCMYMYVCIYIYIYMYPHTVCAYIYIYIYMCAACVLLIYVGYITITYRLEEHTSEGYSTCAIAYYYYY